MPRRCKMCRAKVGNGAIISNLVALCSWDCFKKYQKSHYAKQVHDKVMRKDRADRKERLKTYNDYLKEAQKEFNHYIRVRDKNKSCVSCGTAERTARHGGVFDAGHYRSRGGSPQHRFNSLNCVGQCKRCNRWLSGNVANMRIGLIKRFGVERIEALENDNKVRKFTGTELQRIKKIFSKKRRLYEKKFR